jgi:hypothetical protein
MVAKIFFSLFTVLSFSCFAQESGCYYIVKSGDILSKVLHDAGIGGKTIYATEGALVKVKSANSEIVPNIDKIYPGQKIFIPKKVVSMSREPKTINGLCEEVQPSLRADSKKIDKKRKLAQEEPLEKFDKSNQFENAALASEKIIPQKKYILEKPDPNLVIAEEAQSRLVFSLGSGYSRIDSRSYSNGASAVLLSKPMLVGKFRWEQVWTEEFESFLNLDFTTVSYKDSEAGQVVNGLQTTSLMSLGLTRIFPNQSRISLDLGMREETFATSYSTGVATLEPKPVSFVRGLFEQDLLEKRHLKLSGGLGGSYVLGYNAGSYKIEGGREILAQLKVTQTFKNQSIYGIGEFVDASQNTSSTSQSRREVKFKMGLIIPLGGESK